MAKDLQLCESSNVSYFECECLTVESLYKIFKVSPLEVYKKSSIDISPTVNMNILAVFPKDRKLSSPTIS